MLGRVLKLVIYVKTPLNKRSLISQYTRTSSPITVEVTQNGNRAVGFSF